MRVHDCTRAPARGQGKRDFVGESSNEQVNDRAIVIQRAGELSEFVQVLEDLAVPVELRSAASMPTPDEVAGAAVVVVSGTRLLDGGTPNLSLWPRTLAVVDDASKTLVAHLNRVGAALVIRRPIHPRTLRLVLLHEIYRGPERRRRKRILIGHPIRVGTGLFKQRATLLELSDTGARIELPKAPKIGGKLSILVGKDLTLGKPLKLQAKVVRCIRASGEKGRQESEIGVALVDPRKHHKAVAAILDRFASGPASWSGKVESSDVDGDTATGNTSITAATAESPIANIDAGESERRLPPSKSAELPPMRSAASVVEEAEDDAESDELISAPEVAEDAIDEGACESDDLMIGEDEIGAAEVASDDAQLDANADANAGAKADAKADASCDDEEIDAVDFEIGEHATATLSFEDAEDATEELTLDDAEDATDQLPHEADAGDEATSDVEIEVNADTQTGIEFEIEMDAPSEAPATDDDDRRRDPRIPYDRRVVALGEEAARVLVGRDLSHGGMRIAATETVDVGDTLRVALHCGTELEPLVVLATALRDDGEAGIVLTFPELSDGQRDHLEKIIASSSPIQAGSDDDLNAQSGSVVMGEMLETVSKSSDDEVDGDAEARDPNGESGPVESEDEIEAHLDSIFDTDETV